MISTITSESLDQGFRKINDFATVHSDQDLSDYLPALTIFQKSLGMSEEMRDYMYEKIIDLKHISEISEAALVLLGVMLGLSIAEYEIERSDGE